MLRRAGSSSRLESWGWPLAVVLVVLLAHAPVAFLGEVYFCFGMTNSDLLDDGYPLRFELQRAFAEGRMPVWSQRIYSGWPHFSECEIGALFPLNWVGLSGNPGRSLSVSMLLSMVLAGLSVYRLARALGLSRPGAFVSGVTWPLSGSMLSHLINFNILESMTLAPLGLAFVEEACRPGRARKLLYTAPVVAAAFYAGHPQMAFYSVLAMGALFLSRFVPLWRPDHRPGREHWKWIAVAGVIAGLLGAIQIVPTLDLTRVSFRARGLNTEEAGLGSLDPRLLIRWVHPWWAGDFSGLTVLPEDSMFIWTHAGPLCLVALGAALVAARRRRRLWRPLVLLAITLVVAFGRFTPLHRLVLLVPGMGHFRFPNRMLFYSELILALLLGWMVQELARRSRRSRAGRFALIGLVGAHILGLMLVAWPVLPTVPERLYPPPSPTAEFLHTQPEGRLFSFYAQDAWVEAYIRAEGMKGSLQPYFYYHSTLASNFFSDYGLSSAQGYTAIPTMGLQLMADRLVTRELDLEHKPVRLPRRVIAALHVMSIRWVTSTRPLTNPELRRAFVTNFPWNGFQVYVYEVVDPVPRARVVGVALPGVDDLADFQKLGAEHYDPRLTAIVRDIAGPEGTPGPAGEARMVLAEDLGLVIDARADRDAWLVVADTDFPGWRAYVDGVETPIHHADVVFRAVRLPRGQHRVVFTFNQGHWSLLVALVALGTVLLAALGRWPRRLARAPVAPAR